MGRVSAKDRKAQNRDATAPLFHTMISVLERVQGIDVGKALDDCEANGLPAIKVHIPHLRSQVEALSQGEQCITLLTLIRALVHRIEVDYAKQQLADGHVTSH